MALVKHIYLTFKSLATTIVIISLFFGALHYLNLSFTFDGSRRILAEQIQSYTVRDVRIDGEVELTVSLFPQLLVQRIHISDIEGFSDEDFITVSEVRVAVELIPLLSGHLHISDISADHAMINLIQKKDGSHNWSFDNADQTSEATDTTTAPDTGKKRSERLSLGLLQLTDVTIRYQDESRDQVIEKHLERLVIDMEDEAKPQAEIIGNVQGHLYRFKFESEPLEILSSGKPWLLHGAGHISNKPATFEANLQIKQNEVKGNVDFNVNNVNLGALLDTLGIISAQDAATDSINIEAKLHGAALAELYEQAEIKLQLGKGYWNLQSTENDEKKELLFTRLSSFISWNEPVALHIEGLFSDEAIDLDFKTNRLSEFFDDVLTLDVDLSATIADTDLNVKGTLDLPIKTKQFHLDISLKGKDLEKLNPIIHTDFPPFNDFSLSGNLIANRKGYVLKSAKATIGETQLQASIVIDTNQAKPHWMINLSSQQLQLKDFSFDNWSTKQTDATTVKPSEQNIYQRPLNKPLRQLEDMVRTPDMHFDLNIKVDKLLSGEDPLGKARFQLHLRDNAISLENANIEIPGGRITASISLALDDDETSGHVILNIDKLDYGITTRLFEPDSLVDGIISIRADLQLDGGDFTRLLENATGEFDFAIWPKTTKPTKALNLWATNLYLILLPELKKKESFVNCMVGLMDMNEGRMKEELFAIDTTQLWIYGNINVDFEQEHVELSLFPQSKTARLFSLQTPIRAQGSFTDIGLLLNPIDLTETYISFITSPLHVPARWIFGDKPPKDGSAICEQLFDRVYVKKLNAETEKKEKQEIDRILEE